MSDILRVTGLKKTYPGFTLDGVNLNVEAGTIAGFVGRNGAGKTTTIKTILGLTSPDEGEIRLFGEDPRSSENTRTRLLERIGVVLDTCPFPEQLRVRALGPIGRTNYPRWNDSLFARHLDAFSIDPKKKIKDLSRGMGMKLQIAFALAHEPDLLICDEATAGLDPMARAETIDVLLDFVAEGERAILLSTHITSDLDACSDTVTCIDAGRMVFSLTKEEITGLAGVAICSSADLEALRAESALDDALAIVPGAYSTEVLVRERFAFAERFGRIALEPATVEKYMLMTLGGRR
ncbi:ABC transporter ATP-binding protein [Schaalia sp.]|uniref:ABC transporter ATP-binding protein n=1 Tax=Schaalia sp. TaxID=2691890 RepID=UPI003D1516CF